MTPTQADLDAFNDGVRRARAEYQADHPGRGIAGCLCTGCEHRRTWRRAWRAKRKQEGKPAL
jgi:hypothetical protein